MADIHCYLQLRAFSFCYGIENNNVDVTDLVYSKLIKSNIIHIPNGDCRRASYFSDPLPGILKSIFVTNNQTGVTNVYPATVDVNINLETGKVCASNDPEIIEKLKTIHQTLKLNYGSFNDEYPEQCAIVRYLSGNEKVLEIGGNYGRSSLVIAYLLKQKENGNNQVTLECDIDSAQKLTENRDANGLTFHIESSALSKRPLIQWGWSTVVSDEVLPGYHKIKTISLEELNNKYQIVFDTLILDCEGAFYYILLDMPEILNGIKTVIMENDYGDYSQYQYVNDTLTKGGFSLDYVEALVDGHVCNAPCQNNFYEVYIKRC